MLTLGIIGGGRWSKVIINALCTLPNQKIQIFWITKHGFESAQSWAKSNKFHNVDILKDWPPNPNWDGAIIATQPHKHFKDAHTALNHNIPVLIEKPLALNLDDANALAALAGTKKIPAGVNLEFLLASYLHDFKNKIKQIYIKEITIIWHDPETENRYGDTKTADIYTPITDDILPHIWSVVRVLFDDQLSLRKITITPEDHYVATGLVGQIPLNIELSRRGVKRTRIVSINGNYAALDFSEEPGTIQLGHTSFYNEWKQYRPLTASLKTFIDQIHSPAPNWTLSLTNCVESVSLCEAAAHLLKLAQIEHLETRDSTAILTDLVLPYFNAQGDRIVLTPETDFDEIRRKAKQAGLIG